MIEALKSFFRRYLADIVAVVAFLCISLTYFFTPLSEGLVLGGHDSLAAIGQGHENQTYYEQTGETSRWTNAMFSGMPTYQISPSYGPTTVLSKVSSVLHLGMDGAWGYIFLYLLGFYFLMRVLGKKQWLSAAGAVAWAFSSYFLIIIAAGHIWKVNTLGFIPPTIAGLVLCYRGKLGWGTAVTALFTALQILCNHIQMSYYFLFVMALVVVCYLVDALRPQNRQHCALGKWAKATGCIIIGGILGVAANLPNLYHTYEYSKESLRGKSELKGQQTADSSQQTDGLTRDYITQWSYGVDETVTLLVPDYKGGGSGAIIDETGGIKAEWQEKPGFDTFAASAYPVQEQMQKVRGNVPMPGLMTYWGDQPFTVGPVYVGAFVVFLFFIGLFIVRGPLKWALLLSTMLSLLMAWGKNMMPVTDFFIDFLPMYSKFRTVSSALVIAEFTMPLLAMLTLAELIQTRPRELWHSVRGKAGIIAGTVMAVLPCLWLAFMPGSCLSADEANAAEQLRQFMPADQLQAFLGSVAQMRGSVVSASAWRSLIIILIGVALMLAYWKKWISDKVLCVLVAVLCLADLWTEDKKYLNDDSFDDPVAQSQSYDQRTPADEYILQDTDINYRVMNLATSTFNETSNQTSYWHKSIGGYHAAKLHRYQDLIERYLQNEGQAVMMAVNEASENVPQEAADPFRAIMEKVPGDSICPVLNMLNCKYFIVGQGGRYAVPNLYANGNAWFVNEMSFVNNADQEIETLGRLDTKHQAVADRRFKDELDGVLSEGTARLTSYAPNELRYKVESQGGGLLVFSEIYYPGWTATIDGKEAKLGRVNYVLRALRVPNGKHEVMLEFRPQSVSATSATAFGAIAVIVLLFGWALYTTNRKKKSKVVSPQEQKQ